MRSSRNRHADSNWISHRTGKVYEFDTFYSDTDWKSLSQFKAFATRQDEKLPTTDKILTGTFYVQRRGGKWELRTDANRQA